MSIGAVNPFAAGVYYPKPRSASAPPPQTPPAGQAPLGPPPVIPFYHPQIFYGRISDVNWREYPANGTEVLNLNTLAPEMEPARQFYTQLRRLTGIGRAPITRIILPNDYPESGKRHILERHSPLKDWASGRFPEKSHFNHPPLEPGEEKADFSDTLNEYLQEALTKGSVWLNRDGEVDFRKNGSNIRTLTLAYFPPDGHEIGRYYHDKVSCAGIQVVLGIPPTGDFAFIKTAFPFSSRAAISAAAKTYGLNIRNLPGLYFPPRQLPINQFAKEYNRRLAA
jgi:hypothetical protein